MININKIQIITLS